MQEVSGAGPAFIEIYIQALDYLDKSVQKNDLFAVARCRAARSITVLAPERSRRAEQIGAEKDIRTDCRPQPEFEESDVVKPSYLRYAIVLGLEQGKCIGDYVNKLQTRR